MWLKLLLIYLPILTTPLVLAGYAFCFRIWLKPTAPVEWICSIGMMTLILYGFSLGQMLLVGIICIYGLGLGFLGYSLKYHYQDCISNNRITLSVLLIFYGMVLIYLVGVPVKHGDELSYWAGISKYIHWTQHLPQQNSPFMPEHRSYTPGMALFHQFFLFLSPIYRPWLAYLAQSVMIICALVSFIRRDSWTLAVLSFLSALLIVFMFHSSFFNNLIADALLEIVWAVSLYVCLVEPNPIKSSICLIPLVCFLPFVKEIGFYFGFLSFLFALILLAMNYKQGKIKSRHFFLSGLILSGGLLLFLGFHYSWQIYCVKQGFTTFITFDYHILQQHLLSSDSSYAILRQQFVKIYLLKGVSLLKLPSFLWVVLMMGLIYCSPSHKNNSDLKKLFLVWFFGLLIYSLMQFYLQTTAFAGYLENGTAPAFQRYMGIYIIPLVLVLLAHGFQLRKSPITSGESKAALLGLLGFATLLGFSYGGAHSLEIEKRQANAIAKQYQNYLLSSGKGGSAPMVCEFSDDPERPFLHPYEFIPVPVRYYSFKQYNKTFAEQCKVIVFVDHHQVTDMWPKKV